MRRALYVQLSEIRSPASLFRSNEPDTDSGRVRWVKPVLVGRVEYREFTGRRRHAAWKDAQAVDSRLAVVPPLL
jgi:bifunctional non-homologous end joining protein LigD